MLDRSQTPSDDKPDERFTPLRHFGLPVRVGVDETFRLKVIDACGMTCTFCHNEGTPVSADNRRRPLGEYTSAGPSGRVSIYLPNNGAPFLSIAMEPNREFHDAIAVLAELGYREAHLTGGEPTLHRRLSEIIGACSSQGLVVGMTSNGENGAAQLKACARAGLSNINLSIFGTTAEELARVQAPRFDSHELSSRKIQALSDTIDAAQTAGVNVKANMVIPDETHIPRARRLYERYGNVLSLRLLNSLHDGARSVDAVLMFLSDLGAKPSAYCLTLGASGYRIEYTTDQGTTIAFKRIRPTRLGTACSSCPVDRSGQCEEGYYGLRVYRSLEGYMAGVCIQRMDLCLPLAELAGSTHLMDIRDLVAREAKDISAALSGLAAPY